MKRVHVPEFEDQPWLPVGLRADMTQVLAVLCGVMGVDEVVQRLIAPVVQCGKVDTIVDLGSGAGGIMPQVLAKLRTDPRAAHAKLLLTDLHPSPQTVAAFNTGAHPGVRYHEASVDARQPEDLPAGLKTMINSFHHLSPEHARGVLSAAAAARQPLLVYELADNRLPFALWLLMLPVGLLMVGLSCLLLTLKVRPRRPRQLLLTYVVPILPLLYAWDGQASYPRIYGFGDLDTLLQGLEHPGYTWTRGHAETASGRRMGIYLLGMPAAQPGMD